MTIPRSHQTICHDQSGGKPMNEKAVFPNTAPGPIANTYQTGTTTHMAFRHALWESVGRSMSASQSRISFRRASIAGESGTSLLKTSATTRPTINPQPAEWIVHRYPRFLESTGLIQLLTLGSVRITVA